MDHMRGIGGAIYERGHISRAAGLLKHAFFFEAIRDSQHIYAGPAFVKIQHRLIDEAVFAFVKIFR